jgi:pSer/pThr/pTyr-binding forkhead associated (FHA) protein
MAEKIQLVLKQSRGQGTGSIFVVRDDNVSLGRSLENDIVLESRTVSKFHCEIYRVANSFRIKDLNSSNGTIVDDLRVSDEELLPGSQIRIGQIKLIVNNIG